MRYTSHQLLIDFVAGRLGGTEETTIASKIVRFILYTLNTLSPLYTRYTRYTLSPLYTLYTLYTLSPLYTLYTLGACYNSRQLVGDLYPAGKRQYPSHRHYASQSKEQ